jgi:hypothetical protein
LQLCADGGYQLRLGVLGVPLIMVPDIHHCVMKDVLHIFYLVSPISRTVDVFSYVVL